MSDSPLYVTSPLMPPVDELVSLVNEIWNEKRLTNFGTMHERLEQSLAEFLEVQDLILVNSGTSALTASLQVLGKAGKVITSPFSFVATASSIIAAGCEPIFVDIEKSSMGLDPRQVELALQQYPDVVGILPVHCYGFPSDVEALEAIAHSHRLPVVYDGAHAFKSSCHCGNLLSHGDLVALSFHATKVFSTGEGGAVVANTPELAAAVRRVRNFGYERPDLISSVGYNYKMPELSAALGLINLRKVTSSLNRRMEIWEIYRRLLAGSKKFQLVEPPHKVGWNYAYAPVLVHENSPIKRDELLSALASELIFGRAYFAPLISDWEPYKRFTRFGSLQVARGISERIFCLPLSANMSESEALRVVEALESFA